MGHIATEVLQMKSKLFQNRRDRAQAKIIMDALISKLNTVELNAPVDEDPHTRVNKPRVEQEYFNLNNLVKVVVDDWRLYQNERMERMESDAVRSN